MCRGTLGVAAEQQAAAASAAAGGASRAEVHGDAHMEGTVIDAAPALAAPAAAFKDRRRQAIKDLDDQAVAIVSDLRARGLDAEVGMLATKKSTQKGRLHELVNHPSLFPSFLKVCIAEPVFL